MFVFRLGFQVSLKQTDMLLCRFYCLPTSVFQFPATSFQTFLHACVMYKTVFLLVPPQEKRTDTTKSRKKPHKKRV